MLNLEGLRSAHLTPPPWQWVNIPDFIEPEVMDRLIERYPVDGFVSRYGGETDPYRSRGRRLIHLGSQEPVDTQDIDPVWLDLCRAILGDEYRTALGELIGIDLADHGLQVSIYHNRDDDWLPAHIDNWPKVVTQTVYFNETWGADWGGELLILKSRDVDDVAAVIPPERSNSVVHLRTPEAWHAVPPLRGEGLERGRKSMTIVFYDHDEAWQGIYGDSPLGSVLT